MYLDRSIRGAAHPRMVQARRKAYLRYLRRLKAVKLVNMAEEDPVWLTQTDKEDPCSNIYDSDNESPANIVQSLLISSTFTAT